MNRQRRIAMHLSLCVVVVCAGLGIAAAQGSIPTTTTVGSDDFSPPSSGSQSARRETLTGPQQIAAGEKIQARGYQLSQRIGTMLNEARRDSDIIRVTCLNEKLTQINANVRTVEQRVSALKDAVQTNDEGRRDHEFTVLSVIRQKFQTLELEANQCIGKEIYETGATKVVTVRDPATPNDDPGTVPTVPPVVPFPVIPPPASPSI